MTTNDQAHHIYHKWDEYARSGEFDALLSLYAQDGTIESPLVPILMKRESGVCRGHSEMRAFFEIAFNHRPNAIFHFYRNGRYHFDGKTLIWEYPRETSDQEQIDLMEVMELENGLIQRHKVYWGFRGVSELLRSQLAKSASAV